MKRQKDQRVILIAGPTASGKSAVAMHIAEQTGAVVVNADAMQVYRDLQIITARPDAADLARVPHRLFGHVDGSERYSVGRWLDDTRCVLAGLADAGKPAVITGGTGLYFKALLEGLDEIPEVPRDIMHRWRNALKDEGPWALHAILTALDSDAADRLDPGDGQRIVRALVVKEATGKSILQHQTGDTSPLVDAEQSLRLVLLPDREHLYERIEKRFDGMIAAGARPEVERLAARGLDSELPVMKAIGVPQLCGDMSDEAAIASAKTETRRYAKRQMTWIRGQMADWQQFTEPKALLRQCLDLCTDRA